MKPNNQNLLNRLISRLNDSDRLAGQILENNAFIRAVLEKSIEEKKEILLEDDRFNE